MLCFVVMVKAVPIEDMEIGSSKTFSFTEVSVMMDKGFPPVNGTFQTCCYMMQPISLSYLNFFKFDTLLGL
jgi:hypothetical protein